MLSAVRGGDGGCCITGGVGGDSVGDGEAPETAVGAEGVVKFLAVCGENPAAN